MLTSSTISHYITDYRAEKTGLSPKSLVGGRGQKCCICVYAHTFGNFTAPTFSDVQRHVAGLIRGKIIVGYALWIFLSVGLLALVLMVRIDCCKALGLSHPAIDTRDTALFMPFRKSLNVRPSHMVALATLIHRLMGHYIGLQGEVPVSPVTIHYKHLNCVTAIHNMQLEEARATIDLFRSCEILWEDIIKSGSWPCCLPPLQFGDCFT